MRKRFLALILCGVLAMFSLTGCSGDDSGDSASTAESAAAETATTAESEVAESAATEAAASEETKAEETSEEAPTAESVAAVAEDAAESETEASVEMCSDADYKSLQDAYTAVAEQYDLVEEYYQANFEISEEVDDTLASVKEGIDLFDSYDQSELTAEQGLIFAEMFSEFATELNDLANTLVDAKSSQ